MDFMQAWTGATPEQIKTQLETSLLALRAPAQQRIVDAWQALRRQQRDEIRPHYEYLKDRQERLELAVWLGMRTDDEAQSISTPHQVKVSDNVFEMRNSVEQLQRELDAWEGALQKVEEDVAPFDREHAIEILTRRAGPPKPPTAAEIKTREKLEQFYGEGPINPNIAREMLMEDRLNAQKFAQGWLDRLCEERAKEATPAARVSP